MLYLDLIKMLVKGGNKTFGKHSHVVVTAFTIVNNDTLVIKIDVFNLQAFRQEKPISIQDFRYQSILLSPHLIDDRAGFLYKKPLEHACLLWDG